MSESCLTNNPLLRDGTSQQQRLLKTLLPTYVLVDERSMKDLVLFANKLASEVNYHEFDETTGSTSISDWVDFFTVTDDEWDDFSLEDHLSELVNIAETDPHLALFFGFLYIFKIAQDDLNTITERHLDFYYRDVLQLQENPAVADQAAIIFKLAKNVSSYLVKKSTSLKAGKDDTGVERIYKTEKDIVVNKAQVEYLKAVYANINDSFSALSSNPYNDNRIYISPIANSSDGEGADIETDEKSWNTFGEPLFPELGTGVSTERVADREQAEIGFAISSPILFLAEGTRKITINFIIPTSPTTDLDDDHFIVKLSGEKEWIIPESSGDDDTTLSGTSLSITRTLAESQEAIVAYDKETLILPYESKWPVLSVMLNTEELEDPSKVHDPFIYKTLRDIKPTKVEILVDVSGVKNLVLQNNEALLDADKPFFPFGTSPYIGSNFYIGSWEVFQKKLNSLSIDFMWTELPSLPFDTYYNTYTDGSYSKSNSAFLVDINCLDKKDWGQPLEETALITESDGTGVGDSFPLPEPGDFSRIKITETDLLSSILRDEKLEKVETYNLGTFKGFLKLTLKGQDFGHKVYPNIYAREAILLATDGTGVLPNPPYTPKMEGLSLNYASSIELDLQQVAQSNYDKRVEQYFHIDAFGVKEVDTKENFNNLLYQYEQEGNLFIGIKDLVPPQTLSILFQVAEGSANPDKATQNLLWYYLNDNKWDEFEGTEILSDSTNGLLTSGIVSLSVPKEATDNNTLLDSGYHWIKVAVLQDSDAICKLIDVRCQAVLAAFSDNGNDSEHLRVALAADSISKLEKSDSSINEISQPYASFNGQVAEESADFYTRVSERLRHKQRGITIWDYERLILQNFPSIYKVKCVNHTRFEGTLTNYSEIAPGHTSLIIVSNVQNKNAVDPLRPKTSLSTLDDINDFIVELNPMCATVHVKNPIYEEVRVKFNVKFLKDDIGYYQVKLEQEIKDFLSPWSSDCTSDISFGGRIHKSMIINFVEERSYVDYVTCFEMNHIVPLDPTNNPNLDVEEAIAQTAISILGSSDDHDVTPIPVGSADDCMCATNEILSTNEMLSTDDCPCD